MSESRLPLLERLYMMRLEFVINREDCPRLIDRAGIMADAIADVEAYDEAICEWLARTYNDNRLVVGERPPPGRKPTHARRKGAA